MSELDDEIKAHETIATMCQSAGARDIDGTSIGYVESLIQITDKYRKALEDIRNEFFKESLHDGATASNMLKIANEALK